jgi:branched-chain amino acid transport system substrate-binding protein
LVDVLKEKNVTSVYIVYIEDQHGLEYHDAAVPAFEAAGIEIKGNKSIPLDIQDMTPILNDAKNSGAQAYLMFAYPDQNFLAINQAMSIAYNPDVFLIGPGGSFDSILGVFGGAGAVEGLMSWGAWNEASSQSAADFVTTFKAAFPDIGIDWWGHLPYLTSLQVLQQAIEKAGTLDQAKIRDIIATEKFDTVMGEVWFESNLLAAECYLGQVGQWQNGVFQVIDVGENRTADPIVPKPAWPEPAA